MDQSLRLLSFIVIVYSSEYRSAGHKVKSYHLNKYDKSNTFRFKTRSRLTTHKFSQIHIERDLLEFFT